ncbi:MAG: beta-galactosidase [Anaerolineales bacterium]|nr:beta-galactosidase [Anaerolineales bacterium]MCX7755939.1 beta-galactosidase [Anaerolineales bacterium]MDW8276875.1 beta-galactosidase [Anaerolineales bacterium]
MQRLHFGAAWYPEHWPPQRWAEDIRLMKEAHFTVVRLAEFAWSSLEPSEGDFRFDWLEQAIAQLAEAGIWVVLGTPTAAPPAWLVTQYPETLAVDEQGRRVQFGNRCHYCVNAPEMHRAARRIARAMAERFGSHPRVIGWQVDNEYNRVCYCDHCHAQFQAFLQQEYGTLDELNARWTTAYWSQTYSDWKQIPLPIGPHNPGLMLAFRRFVTRSYRNFQRAQLEELRPHLPSSVWVTHNFMNWFGGFDHYELSYDLDLASWDWYVATGHHDHLTSGAAHDLVRGYKRKNFWLIETQPGHVNWSQTNNALNKMEARAMAWHAVAHGADALLYWQWRSALNGQEQYHGTLIDQSGQPRPFYEEAQLIGAEFARVSDLVIGSTVQARTAILNCYESRWAIEFQRHNSAFDYVAYLEHWYRPLSVRNLEIDLLSADEALDGYQLVIAPALIVLDEQRIEHLRAFVQRGGRLVLTLRTGMKDRHNAMLPSRPPGALAELAGVEVEEYYSLQHPIPVGGKLFQGTASLWAERLRLLGQPFTTVMARYGASNGWLDDQPAVVVNPYGSGFVYTVGAWLDERSQDTLVRQILLNTSLKPFETPPAVEVRVRVRPDGRRLYFVINHSRQEQTVTLPWDATDHLTGQSFAPGALTLYPYAVALLTRQEDVSVVG